jgi:hypothetical protein
MDYTNMIDDNKEFNDSEFILYAMPNKYEDVEYCRDISDMFGIDFYRPSYERQYIEHIFKKN